MSHRVVFILEAQAPLMTEDYSKQWRDDRVRHWSASLGLVLGLPLVGVLAIYLKLRWQVSSEGLFPVLACVWTAVWAWLAFRVIRFPRPRCGEPFQSARVCGKCGLWLYEQAKSDQSHRDMVL